MRKAWPLEVGIFRDEKGEVSETWYILSWRWPSEGGGAVWAPRSKEMSWIIAVIHWIRERDAFAAYVPRCSCPPTLQRSLSIGYFNLMATRYWWCVCIKSKTKFPGAQITDPEAQERARARKTWRRPVQVNANLLSSAFLTEVSPYFENACFYPPCKNCCEHFSTL